MEMPSEPVWIQTAFCMVVRIYSVSNLPTHSDKVDRCCSGFATNGFLVFHAYPAKMEEIMRYQAFSMTRCGKCCCSNTQTLQPFLQNREDAADSAEPALIKAASNERDIGKS